MWKRKQKKVLCVLVVVLTYLYYTRVRLGGATSFSLMSLDDGRINDVTRYGQLNIPKYEINDLYRNEHKKVDNDDGNQRCARYGLKLFNGTKPRRIFFGATIADENWEVFLIHAIEAYDIYHVVALVESNTTFMNTPRDLRFYNKNADAYNLLLSSELFGPKTQMFLDPWLVDFPDLTGLTRESEQRNEILKRWKEQGMTPDDLGILSDIDEVFSRDFLRAVQTCDFPELRPNQSCQRPKIIPSSIFFEATPLCIKKEPWYHPDVISGQCIEGIGDPSERMVPLRDHRRRYGERHQSYGKRDPNMYPRSVRKQGRYPLFNGPDFRTVKADRGLRYNLVKKSIHDSEAVLGAAYHLHNWFTDLKVLRHKYMTYGHPDAAVMEKTLSQVSTDLYLLVRCIRELGNDDKVKDDWAKYYEQGKRMQGNRPIFFLNTTYISQRHELVNDMIRRDEAEFGTNYDKDG
jgi:Glycosyltransferase family 17